MQSTVSPNTVSPNTVFPAKQIHTMDRSRPTASAIAVADGRIVALGETDDLVAAYGGTVDSTLSDKVLLPGFVEAHCHAIEGGFWNYLYVGYFDRTGPDGKLWSGCTTFDQVLDRLREANAKIDDPNEPLVAWGLDPIYFDGERLVASHLDTVSETRQIYIMHASLHLATVNSRLMEEEGIGPDTQVEGLPKDGAGQPIGELQEFAAMGLAHTCLRILMSGVTNDQAIQNFGQIARNAGITTLTDLGSSSIGNESVVERWQRGVDDSYPARVSVFYNPAGGGNFATPDDAPAVLAELAAKSTDKLRFGHVKLILDGSIQGFTARIRWPHYHGTGENGLWLLAPEQVESYLRAFHNAGVTVHAHCNGDEAVDLFLDCCDMVFGESRGGDHRHTIQHCQLTTPGQYRRMRALGLCANLFSNHIFYWGDQHASTTVGPDRAARMNAAATALGAGVPLSMHCDAPVTPLGSLHVAWCAVNRLTASGEVLGPNERISVDEALAAVTIGGAYQLKMDDEVGSLAPGKRADFAVLDDDPYTVDPTGLRDIGVWGTVLGGDLQPSS